jgi:hypothetical protein
MLDSTTIEKIAAAAAAAKLPAAAFERVLNEPALDSDGRDALRIIIVLKPGMAARLTGDQSLDTLVKIQNDLQKSGEDRFAFVEYATEAELEDIGDSRS